MSAYSPAFMVTSEVMDERLGHDRRIAVAQMDGNVGVEQVCHG